MSDDIQISSKPEAPVSPEVTCKMCRRQFAKYTCPTCNAPYCSLTCFRSEAHNQCSESFYKKEIEVSIHSESSRPAEERVRMLELLKKFEEESSNVAHDEESDEDEGDNLAERLEGVDLDSATPEFLWTILSPEERRKFTRAFEDPTSELAQRLLASEGLEKEIYEPWWKNTSMDDDPSKKYGLKPQMMKIPRAMVKPATNSRPLIYNICAVCIGYSYIVRHLGLSSLSSLTVDDMEYHTAKKLVSQFMPFLTDKKSTTLFPDLESVIVDIWSRFELGKMSDELFGVLLYDASVILEPRRVVDASVEMSTTPEIDPSGHPHGKAILVLSDLSTLFSHIKKDEGKQKPNHVIQKLVFYAAHALSIPTPILRNVANSMALRSRTLNK